LDEDVKKVVIDAASLLDGMGLVETVPTLHMAVARGGQKAGTAVDAEAVWAMVVVVVGGLLMKGVGAPANQRCRRGGHLQTSIHEVPGRALGWWRP
jgi:hypothetical protein